MGVVFDTLFQDLRQALRSLRRNPGFATAAIITLALGIGANSAVFSLVYGVLERPLPYRNPERLVQIWQAHPSLGNLQVTYPDFIDWQSSAISFEGIAAYTFQAVNKVPLLGQGTPEQVQATMASHNLFELMGIPTLLGRSFSKREEAQKQNVVMISEALWRRKFGADPAVVGRTIRLGPMAQMVVGVVRQKEAFPVWADIWMPLSFLEPMLQETRRFHPLEVTGRLRPGRSVIEAQAEMAAIAANLAAAHATTNRGLGASVVPLLDQITGSVRPALVLVWLAVGLILLVASANVAHLLLARTLARRRELAIRAALGASSWQLLRVIGTESLLLVLAGGFLGTILAKTLLSYLRGFAAGRIPRVDEIVFDGSAGAYTLAAICLTAVLISIPSFLNVRRGMPASGIKHGGVQLSSPRRIQAGSVILAGQIALSFFVFTGALLLVRSFAELINVNPGFDGSNTLALTIQLPRNTDGWEGARRVFENNLAPQIRALPGVEAVATANMAPMSLERTETSRYLVRFGIKGRVQEPGSYPTAQWRWISEEYFEALKIPLLSGRGLTGADLNKPQRLVNESLVLQFFPDQNPIGKELITGVDTPNPETVEIAGVVGDVRDLGLDIAPVPTIYLIHTAPKDTLFIRSATDPLSLAPTVQEIIRKTDPDAIIGRPQTVDALIGSSLARYRFALWLMAGFAFLAGILCVVGIHGVVAFSTGRRLREFGIRLALGATRWQLVRLVLSSALITACAGIIVGLALFLPAARFFRSLLFEVTPADIGALAGAALLVSIVAIAGTLIPARRASRVDPSTALRQE